MLVENAHKREVTDMVHKTIGGVSYFLSSSLDGEIKAWKIGENKSLVLDGNIT